MSRQSAVDSRQSAGSRGSGAVAALVSALFMAAPASAALTEAPRLAAVYDDILDARFDRIEGTLKQACPPAPAEACLALGAVSLYWQILLDPGNRERDGRFNESAAAAIAASEAWTKREPRRAEAWFYLAGSYAPLIQFRVVRGQRLAAARDGRRTLDALQRALQLDPGLVDANFGIGLYHYYADVAPAAVKVLRLLLLLPGGDRATGLKEMRQARDGGALLKGEADYQLHQIYLWYEHKLQEALDLLRGLDARYAFNPLFLWRMAEATDEYAHDHPASAAAWQALLDRARERRVYDAVRVEGVARIGLAGQLDAMDETDRAIEHLTAVVNAKGSGLRGSLLAEAFLRLAEAHDRLGNRDLAVKAYNALLAQAAESDTRIRARAREGLRQAPDRNVADAYRLALEGWRAFERGAIESAAASLARSIELNASDPVARYRFARTLAARGDRARARELYEGLLAGKLPPPFILAAVYVDYARLLESASDRGRAIEMYRRAESTVASDRRAREEASAALKRLGAS